MLKRKFLLYCTAIVTACPGPLGGAILHSRAAEAINKSYEGPLRAFAEANRFAGKGHQPAPRGDGVHLETGITLLRWKGTEVAMNWGLQQNRSAPDRCSLRINELGGGNYTHSSLGQSIIIVDEGKQTPVPATVLGYDIDGPVQWVSAASDGHYPGTAIDRTFAVLGDGVLVIDRVRSERPRTVDWCLKGAGDGPSVALQEVAGGFTTKPDDKAQGTVFGANLKFHKHFTAPAGGPWSGESGRLLFAGKQGTELFRFHVSAAFSAGKKQIEAGVPVLMVRRRNVARTEFVAFYGKGAKAVEAVPVVAADGRPADAAGARVTLADGLVFHALVNGQPGKEVRLGPLSTKQRFATDYPPVAGPLPP